MGTRALIVGAEHVSYSAVLTLREAGVHPVALVTDLPATQTYRAFDAFTRTGLRVPLWTQTSVAGIDGKERVERVLLRGPDGARARRWPSTPWSSPGTSCRTTSWPARPASLIDPGTGGPACDADGHTTVDGVFAAGNVVHPAETADVAARRAHERWATRRRAGSAAAARQRRRERPACGSPIPCCGWSRTSRERTRPKGDAMLIRSRTFLDRPRLEVTQGGRPVATYRLRRMIPNRSQAIPADWQAHLRLGRGRVDLGVPDPRRRNRARGHDHIWARIFAFWASNSASVRIP